MTKTICLNMIVKNEVDIIQEALDSIVHRIDYWVICDTGSTDGTQDFIKTYFLEKNILGELIQHTWYDFGKNRTMALECCKGKADYIFVMDADDKLVGDFHYPVDMNADAYQLTIGSGFTYKRTQIFGNHLDWEYIGVLHEYPSCKTKQHIHQQVIQGDYYIHSRRIGNRNKDPDKYKKDALLLVDAIEKERKTNNNVLVRRYCFYAGQSFMDSGNYANAIKYYRMRIDMGGWYEEIYYSYYRIAMAKLYLGMPEYEIEQAFLDAHYFLSSRAEPLYQLAFYFRTRNKFEKAYTYASKACKLSFPDDQVLFLDKDVYDWKSKDELGISAFYIQKYQESYQLCQQLLTEHLLPDVHRLRVETNMKFSIPFI